ncbi:MAG TPA: DUF2272 domain-containing protein [Novosphingobium sp.]|nr:DUF2272 domain-containing protein [Novosphingobium sp.]
MKKFVAVTSLNFRSAPRVAADTLVGPIFLGTPVEVTGAADAKGFIEAEADVDGTRTTGFVAERFLRGIESDAREDLVAGAVAEWLRFDRGLGKEHIDPFFRRVGEYWDKINLNLDGKDRDVPWSAAFISYVVRDAGAPYAGFKFAAAHARYINDSIRRRGNGGTPFWGFRLGERKPRIGDLVCRWRESPIDFDTAAERDSFKSHCDIVVAIDSLGDELLAIGGNVAHSVSVTRYKLTAGDFLADADGVFALLANVTDDS